MRGHGQSWRATITELGQRALAGDEPTSSRSDHPRSGGKREAQGPAKARAVAVATVDIDPSNLIADLVASPGQTIRIEEPDNPTRAGYRRALSAVSRDLVPPGKRVTHTGRDRGDLVIHLVDLPDPVPSDPPVPLPESADPAHPVVAWLASHPGHLRVAEESRERALRIVQALCSALTGRGHLTSIPTLDTASGTDPIAFEVTIDTQRLAVVLHEEREKRSAVPAEEIAKVKYDWQRATPVESLEFNGRLVLSIRGYAPSRGWADRKRWTLESRLPRFVATIEEVAEARNEARRRGEEARLRRRREWEEAVPAARTAYLANLNRERLGKQLEAFTHAERMRAYAAAVDQRAGGMGSDERAAAQAWATWIRTEADRHDPTRRVAALMFVEPTDIRPWELDKYMPRGFSASRPPD